MLWYGFVPNWQSCSCPFSSLLAVLASLGPALWIAALNVKYRDFRYVIPFLLQFGLYVSPVGFSSAVVPEQWRLLVQPQPGGRHHRRLPLVPARRRESAPRAGLHRQPGRRRVFPLVGYPPFPAYRTHLRRSGLTMRAMSSSAPKVSARNSPSVTRPSASATTPCATSSRAAPGVCCAAAGICCAADPSSKATRFEEFWALRDREFRDQARRGRRHHRPQRRRQEHAAEDPIPHHRANRRAASKSTAAWPACSKSAPAFIPS